MKVSLLNEKIKVQKAVVSADEIGNRRDVWEDYFSCYSTVGGEKGSEQFEAGQDVATANISFSVRWCSVLENVDSQGYRILFRGEIYNIISVDHMNYKKKSLKFRCRKVRR